MWGSMPPGMPLNGLRLTVELNLGLEKSEKRQGISYCLESGNPDYKVHQMLHFISVVAGTTLMSIIFSARVGKLKDTTDKRTSKIHTRIELCT